MFICPVPLKEPDLASKQVILFGEAQILFRHYICVPMGCDPFVQRRYRDTQIISHLLTRKPTDQRDTHRILAEFAGPFNPIVNLLCCSKSYQRSGIKLRQVHYWLG